MPYKNINKQKEHSRIYYLAHKGKNVKRRLFGQYRTKEEIANYKKEYYKKNREKINIYKNQWQKNWRKNPAHQKIENLRQKGRRKRDKVCAICGSTKSLHYHHWNYDKDVGSTLCKQCHQIQHKLNFTGGI